jgi:CheY-like chemotaxis protein
MQHLKAALGAQVPRAMIALTAFATDNDRARSAEAGFHRHVAKPFDATALVRLLADLLSEPTAQTGV